MHTTVDATYFPDSVSIIILPAIGEFHGENGPKMNAGGASRVAVIQQASIAF